MKIPFQHLLLIILITFGINLYAQEDSIPKFKTEQEKLDYFLKLTDTLRKKGNNPGLAMAIFCDGRLIYKNGMGYRNLEAQLPVTTQTLFEIGSLSKAFTGVVASQLVSQEKIDWDDKVIQHYPGFCLSDSYATKKATFLDLFTHRTGLAQHYYLQYGPELSMQDIREILPLLSFDGSFREKFLYNNLIYTMAGIISAEVDGRSWHEIVKEDIFKPLGMKHSFTTFEEYTNYSNRSRSYRNDGVSLVEASSLDAVAPAGSISSTIEDMSLWVKMLLDSGSVEGKDFLAREQLEFLMSPQTVKNSRENIFYGIGWEIDAKRRTISHDGRTGGQSSRLLLMPDEKFGIVILCNQQTDLQNLLTRYAVNIFVRGNYERLLKFEEYIAQKAQSQKDEKLPTFIIQDPQILSDFKELEGTYEHPAYGHINLTVRDRNILFYEYYEFQGSVEHCSNNEFLAHTSHFTGKDKFRFKVQYKDDKKVAAIEVKIPYSRPLIFKKMDP